MLDISMLLTSSISFQTFVNVAFILNFSFCFPIAFKYLFSFEKLNIYGY
jgi:hypothetical protein